MISFRHVVVSLMPLCIIFAVVSSHSKDVEQHADIRTKSVVRKGFQVCDQDMECVPSFEYCDTKLRSSWMGMQRCGLIRQKSRNLQNFCCPVKQISPIWRAKRTNFDVEKSSTVNVQQKTLEPTIDPSQKVALNLIIKLYLKEATKEGALNYTLTPLQKIALKIIMKASQRDNRELVVKMSQGEALNPVIIPIEISDLMTTFNPLPEGELNPTINPLQEEEEELISTINSLQGEEMSPTVNPLQEEELQPNFSLSQEEVLGSTVNSLQEKEELEPTINPSQEEMPNPTISPLQKKQLNNTIKLYNFTEEPECGLNNISMLDKIFNPKSIADDWPWMAVFLQAKNYMNFCGGVLINRQFVLTAAHCFKRITIKEIIVRLGEYDFTTNNDTQYIDYRLSNIILHPDFRKETQKNDIALVKLNKPTEYNAFIRPICLPDVDVQVYGRVAIVIGWGQTVYGGTLSNVLREVAVPIWHFKECKMAYWQPIYETNICAAGYEGGQDSCLGDSGGPLLIQKKNGRWINVGIVSWGSNCGQRGKPGVYTLVTSYLKWIIENSKV